MLDAQAALHLALVLHELATNARKHGALSVPNGRLSVVWEMRRNGGQDLLLQWRESNGPKVRVPHARGFGSTLIEQTLRAHGGTASVHYGSDGVTCEIKLPLPKEARAGIEVAAQQARHAGGPSLLHLHDDRGALQGRRILIIEDEPLVAMELEASLTAAGCEVAGLAGTLAEARSLVAQVDFDAALLDVNLAGHAVDEIATALTQKNRPFAFVTGYGREALPRGFQDAIMLHKPFSREQLLAAVEVLFYESPGIVSLRPRKS